MSAHNGRSMVFATQMVWGGGCGLGRGRVKCCLAPARAPLFAEGGIVVSCATCAKVAGRGANAAFDRAPGSSGASDCAAGAGSSGGPAKQLAAELILLPPDSFALSTAQRRGSRGD